MQMTRIRVRLGIAVAALLLAAWSVLPARAADDDAKLRERALKLNDVTGADPIKGEVQALVQRPEDTKKLLAVALVMAKEKEQPFNYNAAFILARTADRLKEVEAAQAFYRLCAAQAKKLGSSSKLVESYFGLIELLYENKKYEESDKVCQEFLEMKGDDTVRRLQKVVQRRRIQNVAKMGKTDLALELVENLIKTDRSDWMNLELKGWVQREAGKPEAAAKTYEELIEQIKKDKELSQEERTIFSNDVRYMLSGIYIDLDQVDKAAGHLKALLEGDPDNPTYNNDLGYIWADHDMNLEEAEKMIRKAIDQDRKQQKEANPDLKPEEIKDNAAYLDSLGWVLFKQKKYKEAKPYLLKAVQDKEGEHLEIYDHLGDVHLALGEKAAAVAAWKKGLEFARPGKRDQQRKAEVEKKIKDNQ
jgi:tetratricopeptide (TPR) repeat protein